MLRGWGSLLNRYVRDSAFAAKLLSVSQRRAARTAKFAHGFTFLRAIGLTIRRQAGGIERFSSIDRRLAEIESRVP
jgi:hypothetical protein